MKAGGKYLIMNIIAVYWSVCSCSLMGLMVSKGEDINQHRNENDTVRGWEILFGGIGVDRNASDAIPNHPTFNISNMTTDPGSVFQEVSNGSEGYRVNVGNNSGIPADLFFRWWSVVRPFGNEMVTKPKFPWTVAVQSKRRVPNSHLCSGNILTKLYVLTTCHCLANPTGSVTVPLVPKDPSFISILAGVSMLNLPLKEQLTYGQIRNAFGIALHPRCSVTMRFDYGVIELEYYLYYTSRVLPIPDLFETLKSKKSGKERRHPFLMEERETCQAAGWPLEQTFWNDEANGEQKLYDFMVLKKESCSPTRSQDEDHLVCTKNVNGDPLKTPFQQPAGDIGSGLFCRNEVTAILSYYYNDVYTVFSNLRPALSFLWQYYQDQNEIYTISSGLVPAVSMMLLVFTINVPVISTCH